MPLAILFAIKCLKYYALLVADEDLNSWFDDVIFLCFALVVEEYIYLTFKRKISTGVQVVIFFSIQVMFSMPILFLFSYWTSMDIII